MAEERFKTAAKRFETVRTGVFWDADACKIPVGLNAVVVSQNIRSALKRLNYRGEVSIFDYGDSNKIIDGLESSDTNEIPITFVKQTSNTFDYRGTSIYTHVPESTPTLDVNHTPAGDKDGRFQRILTDFMCWRFDNPAPANVMLVLGDNIHFAYPQKAPRTKNLPVHTKWIWESLSIGGFPLKDEDKRYSLQRVDETYVVSGNPLLRRLLGWSAFLGAITVMLLH